MKINWNESIGKEIIVKISGYEAHGICSQTVTTTILSVTEGDRFYGLVTYPFYLASESQAKLFTLVEIYKLESSISPSSGYIHEINVKATVELKEKA